MGELAEGQGAAVVVAPTGESGGLAGGQVGQAAGLGGGEGPAGHRLAAAAAHGHLLAGLGVDEVVQVLEVTRAVVAALAVGGVAEADELPGGGANEGGGRGGGAGGHRGRSFAWWPVGWGPPGGRPRGGVGQVLTRRA